MFGPVLESGPEYQIRVTKGEGVLISACGVEYGRLPPKSWEATQLMWSCESASKKPTRIIGCPEAASLYYLINICKKKVPLPATAIQNQTWKPFLAFFQVFSFSIRSSMRHMVMRELHLRTE